MSFSLIFQFKESQFLLRIVAEYIGDVIFVWSAPQKLQKKGSVNIFVTGDDRKEPLRYKEPLLHTVIGQKCCSVAMIVTEEKEKISFFLLQTQLDP